MYFKKFLYVTHTVFYKVLTGKILTNLMSNCPHFESNFLPTGALNIVCLQKIGDVNRNKNFVNF